MIHYIIPIISCITSNLFSSYLVYILAMGVLVSIFVLIRRLITI